MFEDWLRLPYIVPVVLICLFALHVTRNAWFSPLSKIPAASPFASWTPTWILYKRLTSGENETIAKAHHRLGDIIRLGPNEISVNCPEGLRTIYMGNFDKHGWYANVGTVNGVPNAFASLDNVSHGRSRRLFTKVYSKSYIQSSEHVRAISQEMIVNRMTPLLREASSSGQPIDMVGLAGAVSYDFITALVFGPDIGTDTLRDMDARKEYFEGHDAVRPYFGVLGECLGFVTMLEKVGIHGLPSEAYKSYEKVLKHVLDMCKAASLSSSPDAVVYNNASEVYDKSDIPWPKDAKLGAEFFDQIAAGFDTVASAIIYLIFELSRNNELQGRLRAELASLNTNELPEARELDSLPLLDAIVTETIRLYPPTPVPLARVVPSPGVQLCGYEIPAGVRISSNAYTLHRKAEVFPQAEEWLPERWTTSDSEQLQEMKRWFWGFGSGARMCFGMHFALLEIKYVIASIYSNFETLNAAYGDMVQMDGLMGRPRGNRLTVRLIPVDKQ